MQDSLASPLHADLPVAALADVEIVEVPAVVRWVAASEDYFPTRFQWGVPRVQNTAEGFPLGCRLGKSSEKGPSPGLSALLTQLAVVGSKSEQTPPPPG